MPGEANLARISEINDSSVVVSEGSGELAAVLRGLSLSQLKRMKLIDNKIKIERRLFILSSL
jgi:hypothetical protein